MSFVWNFATKRKNPVTNIIEAVCGKCGAVIRAANGSTSAIRTHLDKQHQINVNNPISETSVSIKKDETLPRSNRRKKLKTISGKSIKILKNRDPVKPNQQLTGTIYSFFL